MDGCYKVIKLAGRRINEPWNTPDISVVRALGAYGDARMWFGSFATGKPTKIQMKKYFHNKKCKKKRC